MRVWLVTTGEPLPSDGSNCRLLRTGLIAEMLSRRGHTVVWWTSAFDHSHKRHRVMSDEKVVIRPEYELRLLRSIGYTKNVSVRRWVDHTAVARRFAVSARAETQPDVILCSWPTPELASVCVQYGRRTNVPVILDIRDLWPDIFTDLLPMPLRRVGQAFLRPLAHLTRRVCSEADAIIGITAPFVQWGTDYAGRARRWTDRDFPLAYRDEVPSPESLDRVEREWDRRIGTRAEHGFLVCCFMSRGRQVDLEPVLAAARKLMGRSKVRFVLCGNLVEYEGAARGCDNVVFAGWVGAAEIWTLLRRAAVGLMPYRNRFDFSLSIPNKTLEYLSAGLPVVSSLSGTVESLLNEFDCGRTYDGADQLVQILEELSGRPGILAHMSSNAQVLFKRRFRAENVYSDLADHLEALADTGRSMSPSRDRGFTSRPPESAYLRRPGVGGINP